MRFEYDENKKSVNSIATYYSDRSLSKEQLDELVECTTELMDRGYYGEDGWFVDIGERSFYILLVDPEAIDTQPLAISYTSE